MYGYDGEHDAIPYIADLDGLEGWAVYDTSNVVISDICSSPDDPYLRAAYRAEIARMKIEYLAWEAEQRLNIPQPQPAKKPTSDAPTIKVKAKEDCVEIVLGVERIELAVAYATDDVTRLCRTLYDRRETINRRRAEALVKQGE